MNLSSYAIAVYSQYIILYIPNYIGGYYVVLIKSSPYNYAYLDTKLMISMSALDTVVVQLSVLNWRGGDYL